jgi:hypothetical protein
MVTAFPLTTALLLPLLSIATSVGAQASAVPETSAQDAAGMVGVAALAEEAAQLPVGVKPVRDHAVPVQPKSIDLSCPLGSGFARTVDLSTGGTADWRVQGAGVAPFAKPAPVKADALPAAWSVPIGNATWVTAWPDLERSLQPGQYMFSTQFRVLKSPGEMRVTLKGRVLADEKFSVELIEPDPEVGGSDHPGQWGANADAPDPAQLKPQDIFDVDLLVGEAVFQQKPSGSKNPRTGTYDVRVTVENSAGFADAVAMVAQLELSQTCLDWGKGAAKKKRKKKK